MKDHVHALRQCEHFLIDAIERYTDYQTLENEFWRGDGEEGSGVNAVIKVCKSAASALEAALDENRRLKQLLVSERVDELKDENDRLRQQIAKLRAELDRAYITDAEITEEVYESQQDVAREHER